MLKLKYMRITLPEEKSKFQIYYEKISRNPKPFLIGVLVIIVLTVLAFIFFPRGEETPEPITLKFWDAVDNRSVYEELIQEYEQQNPHITIEYRERKPDRTGEKPEESFRNLLTESYAAGEGPDIYTIQNTWVPMEKDRLVPADEVLNQDLQEFKEKYPDVVSHDLVFEDRDARRKMERIYAMPLFLDTLALYYNEDHFEEAGLDSPPQTWRELAQYARILRVQNAEGELERGGVALGASDTAGRITGGDNISNAVDIISLLLFQEGVELDGLGRSANFVKQEEREGETVNVAEEALGFYLSFGEPEHTNFAWDPFGGYSVDAFAEGEVSMMINYSSFADVLRDKNSRLNFKVAEAPQLENAILRINYANYWAPAVSRNSEHPEEAWRFIRFLARENNIQTYIRNSERPVPLKSLIPWQIQNQPNLEVFANQILTAESWHKPNTFETEKIIEREIERVVKNEKSIEDALRDAQNAINRLWTQIR